MSASGYNVHLARQAKADMIKREQERDRWEKEKAEKVLADIRRKEEEAERVRRRDEEGRKLMEQLRQEEAKLDAIAEDVRRRQRAEREKEKAALPPELIPVQQPRVGLVERLRDRQVEVISIEPGGRYRTREVGITAKLKASFWMMKIMAFLAIFVFHDSIIGYVAKQVGRNISVVAPEVWNGYRGR